MSGRVELDSIIIIINLKMKEEEKSIEYEAVLSLIYSQLEKTLEKRPRNPVTKFAKK